MDNHNKQLYRLDKKLRKEGVFLQLLCLEHKTPVVLTQFGWYCPKCDSEIKAKSNAKD